MDSNMKAIFFIFLLPFFTGSINATNDVSTQGQHRVINEILKQLFEALRDIIKNGNSEINVPILDPYRFDFKEFSLNGNTVKLNGNITNGVFTGLGDFEVINTSFNKNDLSFELNIKYPLSVFQSEYYEMGGNISDAILLAGKGVIYVEMHNFIFWSKMYLKQSDDGKSVIIDRFENTNFSIQKFVSRTDFDNNIDEILNAMVEDLFADYINRCSKAITAVYTRWVIETANPFLNQYDTWDLIEALLGGDK